MKAVKVAVLAAPCNANVMAASHSVLAAEVEVVVDNNRGITDQENQTQVSKFLLLGADCETQFSVVQ